jgi:plasmid stabilization system protein ParE
MIDWTEQALRQLDHAHDYIAFANSKEVAARITTQIVTTIQQLAAFPMAGRSGRVPDARELVISNTPFIPAYAIDQPHRSPRHLPRRATVARGFLSVSLLITAPAPYRISADAHHSTGAWPWKSPVRRARAR